ncbi:MAG: hypothetical protein A2008_09315 [Candidatus Wallbacteria bacterium GWC2_49_35]|uniref:Polyprenyl synthetase n=1 Tax=Candidatus Wallbacteria bacterium GWC2_49_35 TaxID=1817813 RepID=A0A1F7WNK1_9BACT|nr:MAG: hypothetical protein A2008_09315 [Candidatus Wallbacteria bacterium GWC2_49_35]HBC74561.1 hypothetical protein [Candidatus Wallbacteria bacterium]
MNYSDIISPVKKELGSVEKAISDTLSSDFKAIDDMSGYVFDSRGKRVRPALLLLSCALAGKINPKAVKTAAAVELIHSATLVHDDIIDNSAVRRGKPSVNNKFGNTAAVLFGDYLYCQAFGLISAFNDKYLADNLLKAARSMCEGEIFQNINNFNPYITFNDYIKIIENKTARFLSKCSSLGAYCAKPKRRADIENMSKFGLNMGIAFQIADDVLDVVSDGKTIGKPAAKDLLEGKITLPVLILFDLLDDKTRRDVMKKIAAVKNKKVPAGFAAGIIDMCREYDTPARSMKIARKYVERSVSCLEKIDGDGDIKENLRRFCEFMADRSA